MGGWGFARTPLAELTALPQTPSLVGRGLAAPSLKTAPRALGLGFPLYRPCRRPHAHAWLAGQVAIIFVEINFSICPAPVQAVRYSDHRRLSKPSSVSGSGPAGHLVSPWTTPTPTVIGSSPLADVNLAPGVQPRRPRAVAYKPAPYETNLGSESGKFII